MLTATQPEQQQARRASARGGASEHGGDLPGKFEGIMPQRHSLAGQVVKIIQTGIQKNAWHEWLPAERILAESLHVSRSTLRTALAQLEKMGVVHAERPLGTRILASGKTQRAAGKNRIVALLTPDPISALRPKIALIVDELRGQLAELGYRLHTFHGAHYFSSAKNTRLKQLVAGHPHDCWVLTLVPDRVKKWFREQNIPCVVSGTCGAGIHVPFVDLDYHALCRHAAGQMTGLGHTRIVFLTENSTKAGDMESERGFLEGIAAASNPQVSGQVMHHDNTVRNALKVVDRLFADKAARPSAMLVANPYFYILVHTYLYGMGLKIPDDISLMCRDDDSFLNYTKPSPTRYSFDSALFARHLFKLIIQTIEGTAILKDNIHIMPDYERGATLARNVAAP
ncbi:MAG: LacI family transcriptional regulator [Opitutaceae bacterium]|jgi:LacI family transcriptional regulator|nr:LacI family transcriptional regulator [Opitutaceae bacterium]